MNRFQRVLGSKAAMVVDVCLILFFSMGALIEESMSVRVFCLLCVIGESLDLGKTVTHFFARREMERLNEEHLEHQETMVNIALTQLAQREHGPRA